MGFNCGVNCGADLMSSSGVLVDIDHLVNKAYADLFLLLSGGALTGNLTMGGNNILTWGNVGFNAVVLIRQLRIMPHI